MNRRISFSAVLVAIILASCISHVPSQEDAGGHESIILQNDHLSLGFERSPEGVMWSSLRDRVSDTEFLVQDGAEPEPFWKAVVLLPTGEKRTLTSLSCGEAVTELSTDGARRTFCADWPRHELVEGQRVSIHLTVTLGPGEQTSRWSWQAECPTGIVVREIVFPWLPLLDAADLSLAVPRGWGLDISDLRDQRTRHFTYPAGGSLAMPFIVLHRPEGAVYLGAPDPLGAMKRFSIVSPKEKEALRAAVTAFPADLMNPQTRTGTGYEIEVGVFPNWIMAAKHYRESVREMPWGQSEHPKERRGRWIDHVDAWYVAGGQFDVECENIVRFAELMDVPVAVHWYNWHEIPFDDHYPEYFPAKRGFKDAVRRVQRAGVRVMPYINARLWDPASDSWRDEGADTWCARQENGDNYVEVYGSKVPLAVMCPYTTFWQNKVRGIVARLFDEFGVDAVYMDQISAAGPKLCFAVNHGHPPGGGWLWTAGYRKLLRQVRADLKPGQLLTTEEFSDPFADLFDAFLMVNTPESGGEIIPMVPAVYSGQVVEFGFQYLRGPDFTASVPFRAKMARAFCWGSALGWVGPQVLQESQHENASYLAALAQLRHRLHEFLVYGELVDYDVVRETVPASTTSVHSALWRNRSGDLAVVMTNLSDEPRTGDLNLDLREHRVTKFPVWRADMTADDVSEAERTDALLVAEQLTLPPRSARAIVFASKK